MKALQVEQFSLEGVKLNEIPKPGIRPDQVLIKVRAASLNYLDLLVVKGIFNDQLPLPHIPLTDISGVVEEVGSEVEDFKVGDGVIPVFMRGWNKGKVELRNIAYEHRPSLGVPGYAQEYLAIHADELIKKPNNLTFEEASTLPIASTSAWNGVKYLGLNPGDSVLLYGTGGVATFAARFAKVRGLKIFVAGLDDEQLEKMKGLGAYKTYNVKKEANWKEDLVEETGGQGVDGIYESVGGNNLANSFEVIRFQGKITYVGLVLGFDINVDISQFLWRQAQVIGMECGSKEDLQDIAKAIEVHAIQPVINKVFELDDYRQAFAYLEKGGHFGKIVIRF